MATLIEPYGGALKELFVPAPPPALGTMHGSVRQGQKGLYAKAPAGIIKEFTGISDPYEPPEKPEIEIDTRRYSPSQAAAMILARLESDGFVA